jgi:UV DNA damage endonuclease
VVGLANSTNGQTAARLGFAVKVLGRPGLKSNDSRRWQSGPHLRVSLTYLGAIFDYLAETEIRMYRISSDIAPYVTHPQLPQFHSQIEECREELAALGQRARELDLRLSMHPSQYIVLNSPDERIAASAIRDFVYHADFLDALGVGTEAKIVTHGGGAYGDRDAAIDRVVARYETLPANVRARLVLENDETLYGVPDTLAIHERCGVPLVFDNLHHAVNNPAVLAVVEACRCCLATWPPEERPKIHFSSQRQREREVVRRNRKSGEKRVSLRPAKAGQHAEDVDAAEFLDFVADFKSPLPFDVMLEAKQKDLALLRLRDAIAAAGKDDAVW